MIDRNQIILISAQDLNRPDVTTVGDVAPIAETMSIPILATDQPLRRAVERAEHGYEVMASVVMAQLVGSAEPTPLVEIVYSELPAIATQKQTLDQVAPLMLAMVNALDQLRGVVLEVDNIWRRRGLAHWADPRLYPLSDDDDWPHWAMGGQNSNRIRACIYSLRQDLNELRIGDALGSDATPEDFYDAFYEMKKAHSDVLQLTVRHYELEEEEWHR